ncbi:uncharacterized protein L969DRAFT_308150 [Mixia osmundae IAM 14324]|uniref:uncharacterized protein n=1 Tax=Mixia osmundae (strain CBS 9802 / IAM 14324 / JCM 22182 / KY 12970) TaxID=764103 RepID=UPI0004A54C45|nr:uncharacterized protein L969DRAFT_308150 [Mixia osmundae IAM 14324]KEI41432.1 hypothetical protein L969DRAFT_308150 [Mixia osmundae IAM 14324]
MARNRKVDADRTKRHERDCHCAGSTSPLICICPCGMAAVLAVGPELIPKVLEKGPIFLSRRSGTRLAHAELALCSTMKWLCRNLVNRGKAGICPGAAAVGSKRF